MAVLFSNPIFANGSEKPSYCNITKNVKNNDSLGTNFVNNFSVSSLSKTASIELDSAARNSITNLYINNDIIYVDVQVKDQNSKIRLSIYNMLAKEVLLIIDNFQTSENFTYQKNISELPNGAYICVMIGNNFRDAEKFLISR